MIGLIQYPKRRWKLMLALILSITLHVSLYFLLKTIPLITIAMGLRGIEFVEEAYDARILINFSKPLYYPPGYIGFRPAEKLRSLEEIKKEEERRARLETKRRQRQKEREEAERRQQEQEQEEEAKRQAEEQAKAGDVAKAEPAPTPEQKSSGYPGGFGKINTAPIKDQIQRLFDANKAGKLSIPAGRLRVGVAGSIRPDGTLADYRITIPSGIKEIDDAAMAILDAVSLSHALGPLHSLTSLSMELVIDDEAKLHVVGFTSSEQEAKSLEDLANAAIFVAKFKKSEDPAAMIMLNNLKVSRTGQRLQAIISVPRQTAAETLSKSMGKGQT